MNEQAQAIFGESVLGVLATINEDGSPRATPVHVVEGDGAVYWFSNENTVHSQNIARDSRVSVTLFSPEMSSGPKGVYISGKAELLDDAGRENVHNLFVSRLGSVPPVFENWSAYRLRIGVPDVQKSTGNCWYFYS